MNGSELRTFFDTLGVRGIPVLVHASLSSFGHVDGGARGLCEALMAAVGEGGTLLMPAFTYAETLAPEGAEPPRRPLAFHPDMPVSREIGVTAETFRRLPGVLRSSHPTHSFAAWGRQARQVLLLGTTLQAATAIHLAEERLNLPYLGRRTATRLNAAGYEERVVIEKLPGCSAAFDRLEERLDSGKMRVVALARGSARKIPVRYLVTLATKLLERDPRAFICERPDCGSCAAKREALAGLSASAVG
jgi:aminoglycoside 3-N-acetyltransferase